VDHDSFNNSSEGEDDTVVLLILLIGDSKEFCQLVRMMYNHDIMSCCHGIHIPFKFTSPWGKGLSIHDESGPMVQ
jgi:hypothetical protein